MPVPAQPLPHELSLEPFAVGTALALGSTHGRLKRKALRAPHRGVRAHGHVPADDDVLTRCLELRPLLGDEHAFSHVTALRLLDVDLPWPLASDHRLHVTERRPGSRVVRPGVVAHSCTRANVVFAELDGVPVMDPANVWLGLAAALSLD